MSYWDIVTFFIVFLAACYIVISVTDIGMFKNSNKKSKKLSGCSSSQCSSCKVCLK